MKTVFYSIYAVMFRIFRIFPLKPNKVVFLSPHNENFRDSLGAVMDEVIMRDEFRTVKITTEDLRIIGNSVPDILKSVGRAVSFFTVKVYHLATAKFVFLNDNFMPMAKLRFKHEAVITQLWHAEGVFKKFGFHMKQPQDIRVLEKECNKKLTYVVCSSESVKNFYSEAFGVSDYKVLPLGAPRTDVFFKKMNEKRLREYFDSQYPYCRGKRLILYAPTFRDNPEDDSRLLKSIDIKSFNERFGDTYVLLIRLHPQIHSSSADIEGAVNVSDYSNLSELVRMCDSLITDYSSICMDFALLQKPVYFYAFDIEKYNNDRSFYFDYESYVPGPVARDFQTLLNLLNSKIWETYSKRMSDFRFFNFGTPDGKASERVVDRIIYNKNDEEL